MQSLRKIPMRINSGIEHNLIIFLIFSSVLLTREVDAKLAWKSKPQSEIRQFESQNVTLNCEFDFEGKSETSFFVMWYKDGQTISLNDQLANLNALNYEIIGKYNLRIKNLNKNDSGLYTCQLFQSLDLKATVNLTVLVAPKYLQLDYRRTSTLGSQPSRNKANLLVENDRIELECCTNDDCNPHPEFTWSQSTQNETAPLTTISNETLSTKSGQICNKINFKVTRDDNGRLFTCSVTNDALNGASIEKTLQLEVEYKPKVFLHLSDNPAISKSLNLLEKSSIELYCNSSAKPSPLSYQWFFNNEPLANANRQTLYLKNLKASHSGNYSCKSSNIHGSAQDFFYVNILYAKIGAANKTEVQSVIEKSSITLACVIKSNPLMNNVKWVYMRLNETGKNVVERKEMSTTGQTLIDDDLQLSLVSFLTLSNVRAEQSGFYACVLSETISDSFNRRELLNLNFTYQLQVEFAPIVSVNKSQVFASENEKVELICNVNANPQPEIKWLFNGVEIANSYKYSLETFGKVSKLSISSINEFDFGKYSCEASNTIGRNSQEIEIEAKRAPDSPYNLIISNITSSSVILEWTPGSNGGEDETFLLNINNQTNVTISNNIDEIDSNSIKTIHIKNLEPLKKYSFKMLAYNSLGFSGFSSETITTTSESSLDSTTLPIVRKAQFNDKNEELCFSLNFNSQQTSPELVLKLSITKLEKNNSDSYTTLYFDETKVKLNTYGHSCIKYRELANNNLKSINSPAFIYIPQKFSSAKFDEKISNELREISYFDAKKFYKFNISVCYANDSSVCADEALFSENFVDISTYFSMIVIGTSATIVFVILLSVTICCCCCTKNDNNMAKANLIIKAVPLDCSPRNFDLSLSDSNSKVSQQTISDHGLNYVSTDTSQYDNHSHENENSKFFANSTYYIQTKQNATASIATVESDLISAGSSTESKVSPIGQQIQHLSIPVTYIDANGAFYTTHSSVTDSATHQQQPANFNMAHRSSIYSKYQYNVTNEHNLRNLYPQNNVAGSNAPRNNLESPESGYSTPTTHLSKKLVYEVIV